MIIAIGGVSTAGKTTLATRLRNHLNQKRVCLLCQDDYAHPIEKIPRIHDRIDWEHPDSIDHLKLMQSIEAEKQQNDIVIVEGLMIFWHIPTQQLFDKKIYLEISRKSFHLRKGSDHRWGIEPAWYIDHIWDSFIRYGKPESKSNMLALSGEQSVSLPLVLQYIGL